MTIEEARKIVATLMATYPNYNPVDTEIAAKTWKEVAEDFTYSQISTGLNLYIRTNASGFAPVPGQIIEILYGMAKPNELNEMEAWSLVSKAIRNSGYNSVEEFSKFPPLVQKAVGLPSQLRTWALDEDYSESVTMSHFIKCYREVVSRRKEESKIPSEIMNAIEKSNQGSFSAQIEQKRQEIIVSLDKCRQIEDKAKYEHRDGIPMPDKYKEIVGRMRNENRSDRC